MDHRPVLLTLVLVTLLNLVAQSNGDDVKHKKVVIKVPKKINHVHHHHIKKIHIWKHKPKPIHSVHVVEEEHGISEHDWKDFSHKHKKFSGWKPSKPIVEEWEEEEEDYDEGEKAASNYEPVVWKGHKGQRGSGGKKWKEPHLPVGRGKGKPRGSYKGERTKRQKSPSHDDWWKEESRYNRRPKGKKPKKAPKGNKPSYYRKPHQKPKPFRSIDKGFSDYSDYDDYVRDIPVWPERKEHISWHLQGEQRPTGGKPEGAIEDIFHQKNSFGTEYNGEIDLTKTPDIQIVQAPVLSPKYKPTGYMQPEWPVEYGSQQATTDYTIQEKPTDYRQGEKPTDYWQGEKPTDYRQGEKPTDYWQGEKPTDYRQGEKPTDYRQGEKPTDYRQGEKPTDFREQEKQTLYTVHKKVKVADFPAKHQKTKLVQHQKQEKEKERRKTKKGEIAAEGFHTQLDLPGDSLSGGYTSHVGHNADGNSASFQSVRFGERIRH